MTSMCRIALDAALQNDETSETHTVLCISSLLLFDYMSVLSLDHFYVLQLVFLDAPRVSCMSSTYAGSKKMLLLAEF